MQTTFASFQNLKSSDPYERQSAIDELLQIEHTDADIPVILEFLISRIEDTLSVDAVLSFLAQHKSKLTKGLLEKFIVEANATINVQSNPYNSRRNIFLLFEHYVKSCPLSPVFIELYTQSIDGEKDPRNLVIIFATTLKVIHLVDISKIRDALYEVTSCYFPITFTNNADITMDKQLKQLLQDILSSPHFSPLTIELIMEKLEGAPQPSLSLLKSTLDRAQSIPHLDKLQSVLFEDIFVRCRPDAIPTMAKLVDNYPPLLEVVITKAIENMTPPDSRNARLASELLSSCSSCPNSCTSIITNTALVFCSMYHSNEDLSFKSAVLDRIEQVCRGVQKCEGFNVKDLDEFHDKFLEILLEAYESDFENLRVSAYSNLKCILLIHGYFNGTALNDALMRFTKAIHDPSPQVKECVISGLREIADMYPKECAAPGMVCDYICQLLQSKVEFAERAICAISESQIVTTVLHHILHQLFDTNTSENAMIIMDLVVLIVKGNMLPKRIIDDELLELLHSLIDAFHEQVHYSQCDAILSQMVLLLSCCLSYPTQQKLINHVNIIANISNTNDTINMIESLNITQVYCAVMCALRQYDYDDVYGVILQHFNKAKSHLIFYECFSKVVCSMLNKLPNDILTRFVESMEFKAFANNLQYVGHDDFKRHGAIFAWITKAAAAKCHPSTAMLLKTLTSLLNDMERSKSASELFEAIFNYSDVCSALNYSKIKSFHVQRMFYQISGDLLNYQSVEVSLKNNYLLAIFGFINNMSESVILMEMETLMPILIDALLVDELQLKSLTSLEKALRNEIDLKILETIIGRLLKCIKSSKLQVKLSALDCLQTIGSTHNPLRFKDKVIYALKPLLDDKKRVIRLSAIKVRYAYILLHN